jgi:hypothetical protein
MGGPVALEMKEILRTYLRAMRKHRRVVSMRFPGKAVAAFREGHNLTLDHADGRITWAEWLARTIAI